jgi:hypothetical protein
MTVQTIGSGTAIADRIAALDWPRLEAALDAQGCAATGALLTATECAGLIALYDEATAFRSRVVMARHGFGQGEYKYFDYPLPPLVATLRGALYARLAPLAERWERALGRGDTYPAEQADYLARCHAAGQRKATPLLLKYGAGDYNRLHQDLYGALAFPLQATLLLSAPGADFSGGEFVLTEQRARMQSRAAVVSLAQGEAVLFAVRERPVAGSRGTSRAILRHGVSQVHSGTRLTLGIIFHDAA